jgi:hypothetical protein
MGESVAFSYKTDEIARLIKAFEVESAKFHPLSFSLFYVTQSGVSFNRAFASPNHAIMLWQYYGAIEGEDNAMSLAKSIESSDLKWGIRGADLTCMGILEGEGCDLFVRMAQRAGSLFDKNEAHALRLEVVDDILKSEKLRVPSSKPTACSNDNPLAIWLNYLLYRLSLTNPGRERSSRIEPDPFSLSLLALEHLLRDKAFGKVDRSTADIKHLRFRVAMSFPGERRLHVSSVVDELRPKLPTDSIFYDFDYQAQLSRPNLDFLLQDIYRNRSDLVVIFLSGEYADKQWCGLEWRSVRDMIKAKLDDQVMFVRFDDAPIEGLLSIDGYIDARQHQPAEIARFILQRLGVS